MRPKIEIHRSKLIVGSAFGALVFAAVLLACCSSSSRWANPPGGVPSHPAGTPGIGYRPRRAEPPEELDAGPDEPFDDELDAMPPLREDAPFTLELEAYPDAGSTDDADDRDGSAPDAQQDAGPVDSAVERDSAPVPSPKHLRQIL